MSLSMNWRACAVALVLLAGCQPSASDGKSVPLQLPANAQKAIFAGGCFWCTESDFEKLPGVVAAVSGYTGGHTENVRYEDTHDGSTGHTEAVEIIFDPDRVSYAELVEIFFHEHDPLDGDGQFCDRGNQYRPAVFYLDEKQKALALAARKKAEEQLSMPIKTEITSASTFWKAEEYHQDYYKKNPLRYRYYRNSCGRDDRIEKIWESVR